MGKMKDISITLQETEERLYNFGITDETFIQNCKLLCELGFADEVQCIIWEYENFLVNEGSAP